MDKQAQRLASLTSEVSARDRLINRRLQHIERLEKQVHRQVNHIKPITTYSNGVRVIASIDEIII